MIANRNLNTKFEKVKNDALIGANVHLVDALNDFFLIVDVDSGTDPVGWFKNNKNKLNDLLISYGVLMIRGSGIQKDNVVSAVSAILPQDSLIDSYAGGVTNRPKIDTSLFLTTMAPAAGAILQHHEMSYLKQFPKKIIFFCNHAAEHGGATPVTSSRTVKAKFNKDLFNELKKRGVCYIRNYYAESLKDSYIFLGWQKAFEVNSKSELDDKLKKLGFNYQWFGDRLQTKNVQAAVTVHPVTNEEFLFNHSFVLNSFSRPGQLGPSSRAYNERDVNPEEMKLVLTSEPQELPYLVTWGDNHEIISLEILEELFRCYNDNKISLNYRNGDLMIVDNILASHGRDPFLGKREVFAMLSKN